MIDQLIPAAPPPADAEPSADSEPDRDARARRRVTTALLVGTESVLFAIVVATAFGNNPVSPVVLFMPPTLFVGVWAILSRAPLSRSSPPSSPLPFSAPPTTRALQRLSSWSERPEVIDPLLAPRRQRISSRP